MTTDSTARPGRPLGIEDLIPATLMRPFVVVVRDEVRYGLSKVALSERNDPIQTLLFDRTHEPLGVRVRIRRTIQRLDDA